MNNLWQRFRQGVTAVQQNIPGGMRHPLEICSRFFIHISAFIFKEIFEIMRQPLLILTLVLGPFLILLFFGLGYRNEPRALRTLFVVEDDYFIQSIQDNASNFGPQLIFAGITDNVEAAQGSLRNGDVDLVTVIPSNAFETILDNRRAPIVLYHHEIDPFQLDYINVFGRVYVDEANRRILRYIFAEGQVGAQKIQEKLELARQSVGSLRAILEDCAAGRTDEECNKEAIQQNLQALDSNVDEVDLAVDDNFKLIDALEQELAGSTPNDENQPTLDDLIRDTNELTGLDLDNPTNSPQDYEEQLDRLTRLEASLELIEKRLIQFAGLDPAILISPFRSQAQSIAAVGIGITDFFAPSVIVLLLQHLTVTFAALSMVRERQLGTMEIFNVSPISALETLLGKYLSYMLFGGILATVLLSLAVFGMGVPNLGSSLGVALAVLALLFTSLGIGFIISIFSKTDIQAVQYAMIVLLTSVFFSGFILPLAALWEPVRIISWALPATYGILMLRNIMLRGDPLSLALLLQFFLIGLGLFVIAWVLLRRLMAHIH